MESTGFFGRSVRQSEEHRALVLAGIDRTLREAFGRPRAMRSVLDRTTRVVGAQTGCVFLLDPDGQSLRGAFGLWDGSRANSAANLADWPSIARAMSGKRSIYLTGRRAHAGEREWFEGGGIQSCLCAPISAGKDHLGILFLDFVNKIRAPSGSDRRFARAVALSWASATLGRVGKHAD